MRRLSIIILAGFFLLAVQTETVRAQRPRREKTNPAEQQFIPSNEAQVEPQGERRPPPDRGPRPRPDFMFQSFEMFSGRKVVKGAPYSATAITETVQTLADGTKITQQKTETVYRDGEGRTRRELKLDRIGPFSVVGEPSQMIFIDDVVAGERFALDANKRTARKMQRFSGPPPPAPNSAPPFGGAQSKTETLGKRMIEGVEAEGVRTTLTIPAGRIGNDRPIEITAERWDSTELQTVVLSKHKDPRVGETIYRLTHINRGEQPLSLFEIPSDYSVEQGPPPKPKRRPNEF
jgi:hypothetical protein